MKSEKLMDALGELDDRYLLAVLPEHLKTKKRRWPVVLAAAAMVGLCIFGIGMVDKAIPPKQDDMTEQLAEWTQPELNKLLWEHAGEADRTQLELSELQPFSRFLYDNQNLYEGLLTQEGLQVYLNRVGAKSVCVLDAPELGRTVRLQCGMNQVVIDCTEPPKREWRKRVEATIQTVLDDAAAGKMEQEEAEGVKAAFGSWLQRNCPDTVDWDVIHGQMQQMENHSVKLSVMQEDVRLFDLNWYGGELVEVCWPEKRDEVWYSTYQNMEISVEDAVYFLYERDPDQQKTYFTHWLNFLCEVIPADAKLEEPLTARLAIPILKQFTIEKLDRIAFPTDLPNSPDQIFTRADLENMVEELQTQAERYRDRKMEDGEIRAWQFGAQMYDVRDEDLPISSSIILNPKTPIGREELATMLYRAAIVACEFDPWEKDREEWMKEYPGVFSEYDLEDQTPMTVEEVIGIFFRYTDQVLGWQDSDHTQPMEWAGYHGLLTGGEKRAAPQDTVTRVQAVGMLRQLTNEPYYLGVPRYYDALPDGTVICTEPMTAQTELDAVQTVAREYLTQRVQMRYKHVRGDMRKHTVLELQERDALPESIMEAYGEAIKAGIRTMEAYYTLGDLAVELQAENQRVEEEVQAEYTFQEVTRHGDFAFVKVLESISLRHSNSDAKSFYEKNEWMTLLHTEDGWFVLSLENRS